MQNIKNVNNETENALQTIDMEIEKTNVDISLSKNAINNKEQKLEENIIEVQKTKNDLENEITKLNELKKEEGIISNSLTNAEKLAQEVTDIAIKTSNLGKSNQDVTINALANIDLQNFDFNSFDFNQFGKELDKDENKIDISSMNKFFQKTVNINEMHNAIEYAMQGNLKVTEDPKIEEQDIDKLIDKLDLNGKIELTKNFKNLRAQAKNLAYISKEQAELAYAAQEIKKLQENVTNTSNAASLTRILAAIENAKKQRIEKKIQYQNEKIEQLKKELNYKKKIELETKEKIELEIELKKELEKNQKINLEKKKNYNLDLLEIDKELIEKEEESSKSKKLAKFILDKIALQENKLVIENLNKANELEKKEILDLVKLNIYSREEIEEKIKNRYHKKKLEYELEYSLEHTQNEIRTLQNIIDQNMSSQVITMRNISQIKTELNNSSSKTISYKSLILTEEQKYKKEKDHWEILLKTVNENIEELLNDELSLLNNSKNIEGKYNTLIELNVNLQKELDTIMEMKDNNELISNKKNEIDKIKMLIKNNRSDLLKITNRYEYVRKEREKAINEKYKIHDTNKNMKDKYDKIIRNIKSQYEKAVIIENHNNKKLIRESYKLSELSDKNIKLNTNILILNKKIESILIKDVSYSEKYFNNSLKEVSKSVESTLIAKKEEIDLKSIVKLANENLENIMKIKIEKIDKLKHQIKNESDKTKLVSYQKRLGILQTSTTTMEKVAIGKIKSANVNYNIVIEKRILTQLDEIKTQIDRVVLKIILLTKEIQKINKKILIILNNKNLETFIFKKKKLDYDIIKNELLRLTKIKNQGIYDLEKRKLILQEYNSLILKNPQNKSYKNLSSVEENNIKIINKDLKNVDYNITNLRRKEIVYTDVIDKLEKKLINIDELSNYKITENEKILTNTINTLGEILKEYKTLAATYLKTRENIDDTNIKFPKIALNPLSIPEKIKKNLYVIFDNKKLEYNKVLYENEFIKGIDKILKEYTNIVKNEKIKEESAKLLFKYNKSILKKSELNHREKLILRTNLLNELESSLNIDKKFIDINDIIVNENTIDISVKITLHDKYQKIQSIIDYILEQYYDVNSKLRIGRYGKELVQIINNVRIQDDNLSEKVENNDMIIDQPLSITRNEDIKIIKQYHYLLDNYDNDNKQNLLAHYPFRSNKSNFKNTLVNYNDNGRNLYKAIDNSELKNIYENYISLDNTLLKAENINLMNNKEFTISFLAKLLDSNRNQQILLSNGIISEYLQSGYINWNKLNDRNNLKKASNNNNILSIGFINNYLYIKLPCLNQKYFYSTPESKSLYVNNNEWHHWIITMKNDLVEIYKDDLTNPALVWKTGNGYNDINNTCVNDNKNYEKTNLYIGGLKTDLDVNTNEINKIISYKGGLSDLRIYKKYFSSDELKKILIKNEYKIEKKSNIILPKKIINDNQPKIIRTPIKNTKSENTILSENMNLESKIIEKENYEKSLPVKRILNNDNTKDTIIKSQKNSSKIVQNKMVNMNYNNNEIVLSGNNIKDLNTIEDNINNNIKNM